MNMTDFSDDNIVVKDNLCVILWECTVIVGTTKK